MGAGITPGVATDSQGNIHVVYMYNGAIYYKKANSTGVFGATTLAELHDWTAPAGVTSSVDAQYGVALLTAEGKIYAVSLATGRRSLIASVPGRVFAQIEPSGIAYAYNTGTRGHLRFVRLAEVEAALG